VFLCLNYFINATYTTFSTSSNLYFLIDYQIDVYETN